MIPSGTTLFILRAPGSDWLEQTPHKRSVLGSSPRGSIDFYNRNGGNTWVYENRVVFIPEPPSALLKV